MLTDLGSAGDRRGHHDEGRGHEHRDDPSDPVNAARRLDPECDGDHGYTGTSTADDLSVRVSEVGDGVDGGVLRRVVRLGRRELHARLAEPPAPLTNVRLRLQYPSPLDRSSEAIYAKVLDGDAAGVVRMRLTAVSPADEQAIGQFLR